MQPRHSSHACRQLTHLQLVCANCVTGDLARLLLPLRRLQSAAISSSDGILALSLPPATSSLAGLQVLTLDQICIGQVDTDAVKALTRLSRLEAHELSGYSGMLYGSMALLPALHAASVSITSPGAPLPWGLLASTSLRQLDLEPAEDVVRLPNLLGGGLSGEQRKLKPRNTQHLALLLPVIPNEFFGWGQASTRHAATLCYPVLHPCRPAAPGAWQ
jgi:hypothetical protein